VGGVRGEGLAFWIGLGSAGWRVGGLADIRLGIQFTSFPVVCLFVYFPKRLRKSDVLSGTVLQQHIFSFLIITKKFLNASRDEIFTELKQNML
jgi:hypothetical protein